MLMSGRSQENGRAEGTRQGEEASGSAGASETARQCQVVDDKILQPTKSNGDLERAKKRREETSSSSDGDGFRALDMRQ